VKLVTRVSLQDAPSSLNEPSKFYIVATATAMLCETDDEEADKLEPTICLTCPCRACGSVSTVGWPAWLLGHVQLAGKRTL